MATILFTIERGQVKSNLEGFKGLTCNSEAAEIAQALAALGLDMEMESFTQTRGAKDQKVALQTGTTTQEA